MSAVRSASAGKFSLYWGRRRGDEGAERSIKGAHGTEQAGRDVDPIRNILVFPEEGGLVSN